MALEIGDVIQNKYKIVGVIGQGGMGAVFEGENMAIARRVAIKVLHQQVASQAGVLERFEREAQAAGRIGNDHILEVLDMGTLADGDRFMVMEFLDGETLQDRIQKRGRMSPSEAANLSKQLLTGLLAAHHAGIIHRDLKPENVFILREKAGRTDFVKIIDFGISKFTQLGGDMKMTATGAVMGTPYYMSPEQAKGTTAADARSDLYAVGVILYKAITGQVPFDGQTFNELLFKIVLSPLPNAREFVPDLDPAFESIICKAMARDAGDRFQTAEDFIAALTAWEKSGSGVSLAPASTDQSRVQRATAPGVVEPGTQAHSGTAIPTHTPAGTLIGDNLTDSGTGQTASGAWSNSEIGIPKKSNAGALTIVALGSVLILGGAAFAAYSALGETSETAVATDPADADKGATQKAEQSASPREENIADHEPQVSPAAATAAPAALPNDGEPTADPLEATAAEPEKPTATQQASKSASPNRRPVRPRPSKTSGQNSQKQPGGDPDFGY